MGAGARPAIAALVALLAAVALSAPSAAFAAPSLPPGPSDIAIPYGESATIEPRAPWRVADCGAVAAASPLVRSCDAETIVVAPDAHDPAAYDPDAGIALLPVTLTTPTRTLTVVYRLSQEPPPAPSAHPVEGRAVAAGATLRVGPADFGLACTVCGEGGSWRVSAVDPAEAGEAWTTPTHVVFRAARDYRGPVDVHVAVADDHGAETPTGISAVVYPGREGEALAALDAVVVPDDDGVVRVDLLSLVAAIGGGAPLIAACGPSLYGTVSCSSSGEAVYVAAPGAATPDQFGFHVVAGGEQAYGSVTVVPADATASPGAASALRPGGTASLAPPPDDEPVRLAFVPPTPPEAAPGGQHSVLAPVLRVLDRVGAR